MVFSGKIYNPDSLVSITQLRSVKSVEIQLLNGDKINCLVFSAVGFCLLMNSLFLSSD